jgi:hypothetical protein
LEQLQNTYTNGAAESEMKNRITAIIIVCLLAAAALLLWRGLTLKLWLANRFETVLARPLKLNAPGGPYDTTDHFLKPLEIPHPSETLALAMAEIPPNDAVIFITAGDDNDSELIYRAVSYLGWPRRIGEVRCGGTRAHTEEMFLPPSGESVKWLMFYRIVPPAGSVQSAKKIGPYLTLTPSSELKEWRSYCSQ